MARRYRRIVRGEKSRRQSYQLLSVAVLATFLVLTFIELSVKVTQIPVVERLKSVVLVFLVILVILTIISWSCRERVAEFKVDKMSFKASLTAQGIRRLFNDKTITEILKLSNTTRFGEEMPEIHCYVNENQSEGYIAIENIANYKTVASSSFEQQVSGIISGKYQKYSVVSTELVRGDSYVIFHFEDSTTSHRFNVRGNIDSFISEKNCDIRLADDLVWHADIVPHLSIIARTRSGKTILAGRYMAEIMKIQGWTVEYNSAKEDRYVKLLHGKSNPLEIVERAEYWCFVMDKRLKEINEAGKEKYLDMDNMENIGIFFDELGNLNAALDSLDKSDRKLKANQRWVTAINRLSATGGSAGIHIIAISQFATKEGFLPSLARVNCSDAVIMLGGAADSADERKYLMSGFADMPKRRYGKGQGIARIVGSGRKWEDKPHFYEAPWVEGI